MQQDTQPANLLTHNKALNKQIQNYYQKLFPILILRNAMLLGSLLVYIRQQELNPKMKYIFFTYRGKT